MAAPAAYWFKHTRPQRFEEEYMPAFLTHMVFGEDVCAMLPKELRGIVLYHRAAFDWGLVGPDLLYFSKVLQGNSPLPQIGSRLHKDRPERIFALMSEYILMQKNKPDYPVLVSYLCGFVCHYRLDSTAHPYIHAYARRHEGISFDRTRGGAHHRVEADIDTKVYRLRRGADPTMVQLGSRYTLDKPAATSIAMLYHWLIDRLYDQKTDYALIVRCFRETLVIERLLLDPTGFAMKWLASLVDQMGRKVPFSSHVVAKEVYYDVLNRDNMPLTGCTDKSQSFTDLYELAAELSVSDLQVMLDCFVKGEGYYPAYTRIFDCEQWD